MTHKFMNMFGSLIAVKLIKVEFDSSITGKHPKSANHVWYPVVVVFSTTEISIPVDLKLCTNQGSMSGDQAAKPGILGTA